MGILITNVFLCKVIPLAFVRSIYLDLTTGMHCTRWEISKSKIKSRRANSHTWFLVGVEDALPADPKGHEDDEEEDDEVDLDGNSIDFKNHSMVKWPQKDP